MARKEDIFFIMVHREFSLRSLFSAGLLCDVVFSAFLFKNWEGSTCCLWYEKNVISRFLRVCLATRHGNEWWEFAERIKMRN
jgi:hypothetical protein